MNAAGAIASGVYLRSCLAPLADVLAQPDVTDIFINRPQEIWIERVGGEVETRAAPALTDIVLERLARQVAALSHQGISREHPLLGARLEDGSRIQIIAAPATRGPMAIAIRKHVNCRMTLKDYEVGGHFRDTAVTPATDRISAKMQDLLGKSRFGEAMSLAVRERKTVLISGGTSTGKTTFLNALVREIPAGERLILIEDTPEISLEHANSIGTVSVRGELGEARVSANDLVTAALRMRPDRIILGELRGREALAFLRAINSGHPGSMSTIHADSADSAIDQLVMLVQESGSSLSRQDIGAYALRSIDYVVHLGRREGRRMIESILPTSSIQVGT